MHGNKRRPVIWVAITCILALMLVILGIQFHKQSEQLTQEPYYISVEAGEAADTSAESLAKAPWTFEDHGHYCNYEIQYHGVSSVTIAFPEESVELEYAVRNGRITAAQLIYQAEKDCAEGVCTPEVICDGNLTLNVYRYPSYSMGVMNDLYVTNSGEEYLYKYIVFGPRDHNFGIPVPMKLDDGALIKADREDWGITLTARDISNDGLTLCCAQGNVLNDGTLYVGDVFTIYKQKGDNWELLDGWRDDIRLKTEDIISRNWSIPEQGEAEYILSWEDAYGSLDSGVYNLWLNIHKDSRVKGADNQIHGEVTGQRYKVQIVIP